MVDPTDRSFLPVAVVAPVVLSVLVFLGSGLATGLNPAESLGALIGQSMGRRYNPLISGALGIVPTLLLLGVLRLLRRFDPTRERARAVSWTGLFVIQAIIVWAALEFWPKFLPDRVYPGFPHGLELVIGPLIFAPVALIVLGPAAWFWGRGRISHGGL